MRESRGRRPLTVLVLLALVVGLLFMVHLAAGSVSIPPDQVLEVLLGGETREPAWRLIVLDLRLPRALTALLAGAALAVSGLLMQTLFRNPLAGPYVLGLSAGASLGVALVVLASGAGLGLLAGSGGALGTVAAAMLGAMAVLALVLAAARRVSTLTLLILGVLIGYATGALVTLLLHWSAAERVQAYLTWTFGSFGGVTRQQLWVLAPTLLVGLSVAGLAAKPLNALVLGESYARSLGLAVGRARWWVILATAFLAGAVTAFCGPVGFLGVAVPHLCRGLLRSSDHRVLVPGVALTGSAVALFADLLAQMPGREGVLPLNAVTALVGTPVIAWVILRRRALEGGLR